MQYFISLSLLLLMNLTAVANPANTPELQTLPRPAVDILFVIDDSGSMTLHQQNLVNNISLFSDVFVRHSQLDYQIGVVTSSTYGGGASCCGKLVGNVKIVDRNTLNKNEVLRKNMLVGTIGNGSESLFSPIHLALSEPLLSTWNKGFLRPHALLTTIFITDADDQSPETAQQTFDFLLKLKDNKAWKILTFGVIIPTGEENCERDAGSNESPKRLEEFLGLSQNAGFNTFSLCDSGYGLKLQNMAQEIVRYVDESVDSKTK
jgi:hypothetical protein